MATTALTEIWHHYQHAGIIACTTDRDWEALANRIDAAIAAEGSLTGKLIRVVRPALKVENS